MAKQPEEKISRRRGRVDLLLTDLAQLPDGYQPAPGEAEMFAALGETIGKAFKFGPWQEQYASEAAQGEIEALKAQVASLEAELAQAQGKALAPEAAPAPEAEKLPENGKRKTGT